MFRDRKILPFVGMVVSVLYFIYVMSLGSSTMIGDEIGGDPGGMVLPLVLSIFMFLGTTALFLTDKKQSSQGSKMETEQKRLFVLTVAVTLLYVLMARPMGYLLTTAWLLHTLTFFYLRGDVRAKESAIWLVSLVGSTALLVGLYTIGRRITRFLLLAGRQGTIPAFLGSTSVVVAIVLIVVTALFLLFMFIAKRVGKERLAQEPFKAAYIASMIAVATTELIYLIFRQLFLVELVRGIIQW